MPLRYLFDKEEPMSVEEAAAFLVECATTASAKEFREEHSFDPKDLFRALALVLCQMLPFIDGEAQALRASGGNTGNRLQCDQVYSEAWGHHVRLDKREKYSVPPENPSVWTVTVIGLVKNPGKDRLRVPRMHFYLELYGENDKADVLSIVRVALNLADVSA